MEKYLDSDEVQMLDFLKKCLEIDPTKRMSCSEALNHPWFSDISKYKEIDNQCLENFNIIQ